MPQDPTTAPTPEPTPSPKKRRGLWWKIVIGLVVLIVLLVALLPTIASTSMVRSIVLGKVNDQINGHVDIDSWSLGWFSPISVSGIKVYDEDHALIADVPRVKLGLSLLNAIRSKFEMGDDNVIDVASFVLRVNEAGESNVQHLAKKGGGGEKAPPPPAPSKLPDLSGKFTINLHGTIESTSPIPGQPKVVVHVDDGSTAVVTVANINSPIQNNVKLVYRVGDGGTTSTVALNGDFDAIKNNILDVANLAAGQKIDLHDVNLAAIEPFLKSLGADTQLAGAMTGGIEIKAQGLSGLSANGQIVIKQLVFGGGPLGSDHFKTEEIAIPVNITRTVQGDDSIIKFENVGVQMSQGTITIAGQVSEKSLLNLAQKKAPGMDGGSLSIAANITGLADIASQLSHTLNLQQGVQITGGHIDQKLTVTLSKDKITVAQDLKADATGTNNGKQVQLQPISVDASAAIIPNGTDLPDVRDLKLAVQSAFATVNGGGDSLAKTQIDGKFDLGKLSTEVGQFADLGQTQLQGSGDFNITTSGDLATPAAPIALNANANLQNVKIVTASQHIDQDRLAITASGNLLRDKNLIDKGWLSIVGGDPASPLMEVDANATTDLAKHSLPWFELKKCTITSLQRLQQEYGSLVPALAQQKTSIDSGVLMASAAGSFADQTLTFTQPAKLSITNLTVSKNSTPVVSGENLNASAFGNVSLKDGITANISELALNTDSKMLTVNKSGDGPLVVAMTKNAVQGNGAITIAANLKPLADLAQAFSGPAPTTRPSVTSGQLNGTLAFSKSDQPQTNVKFDSQITGLALANGQRQFAFDTQAPVSLKLAATVHGTDSIDQIEVTDLSGDLRVARLSMPQNIVIKAPLSDTPKYAGQIKLEGQIQDVTPLLAVIQAADPMPYSGGYVLAQKISNNGNVNTLDGSVDVKDFKVLADNRRDVIFSEPQVAVRNNINVDTVAQKLAITTLTVDMPASQALAISVTGGVDSWNDHRAIRPDTKLDLTYDLAKLWPIIKPMLSQPNQASLADLKIAGKSKQTFTLSGAFPARPAFTDSIKTLNADGGFAIDSLSTSGLAIQKFAPQIKMRSGVVTIGGQPATANDGKLDVSGITLDLTKDDPLLSIQKNKKMLEKVKLNPVLADVLGKIAAVIFSNATEASGLLNVTVVQCDKVPLGALLQKRNDARAEIKFSISELQINGPIPSVVAAGIGLGGDGFRGSVPESSAKLADGQVTTDMTLLIGGGTDKNGRPHDLPMRFAGGMGLQKLDLRNFVVTIPKGLIPINQLGGEFKQFAQLIPDPINVPLTGTADKPKFDFKKAITSNAPGQILNGGNVGDLLNGLGGQPRQRQPRNQGQ